MTALDDLTQSRWFLPALAFVALLVANTILLYVFKDSSRTYKRRGKATTDAVDPDAGTVFVQEDGHTVRRSSRVRKSITPGDYATLNGTPIKTRKNAKELSTSAQEQSAPAAEPSDEPAPAAEPSPPSSPVAAAKARRRVKA